MYSLSHTKLARQNVPTILQKPIFMAFMEVLQSANVSLYERFMAFKIAKDLRLAHNGTVESLETLLNYLFPTDSETSESTSAISIVDAVLPTETYIGCAMSDDETYICSTNHNLNPDTYIGCAPNYLTGVDFVVNVPSALQSSEVMIKKIVNEYRTAGKLFAINYI